MLTSQIIIIILADRANVALPFRGIKIVYDLTKTYRIFTENFITICSAVSEAFGKKHERRGFNNRYIKIKYMSISEINREIVVT